jgi:hypothetical protein
MESLPRVYPKHQLLAQRRESKIGRVRFSLLVYKGDIGKPDVTIEGQAILDSRAWRFSAHCSSDDFADGLVTTLEQIAKLPSRAN